MRVTSGRSAAYRTGTGGDLGPAFDHVLAAAQANAGWAFTRLYESLAATVAGYIRSQGVTEAEDLTSEVFLVVLSRTCSFAGTEAQFRSWVFTIAHHRVVDARRRKGRRPEPEPLDVGDRAQTGTCPAAEDDALRRLGTDRVLGVLSVLAPDQQNVLALRMIADMSVDEVAAALAKRPEAVRALQRRALASLRRELSDDDGWRS